MYHSDPLERHTQSLSLSLSSTLVLARGANFSSGAVPLGSLTLGKANRPASRARPSCPLRTIQNLLLRRIGLSHAAANAGTTTTSANMHLKSVKCNRFCLIASLEDPDMFNQPQARVRSTAPKKPHLGQIWAEYSAALTAVLVNIIVLLVSYSYSAGIL